MTHTLFEKIWNDHVVVERPGCPAILYVDLHLVHEVTSPQAFTGLSARGLRVRRPDLTVATMDHSTPTIAGGLEVVDEQARAQLEALRRNCSEHGVRLHAIGSARNGIVHVMGPELGLTQPGMTIVCGDSHTATHGAFGALAFGIGTTEVEHVLATQCILQRKPRTLEVRVEGRLGQGVTAKDLILALIAKLGADGGTGHVIEYTGAAIRALDMDGRMTVCNMSIEAGARAGMIAPDDVTFDYLAGREHAPVGVAFEQARSRWQQLCTDPGAHYDHVVSIDASTVAPMITWGTSPAMAVSITDPVPDPNGTPDQAQRASIGRALHYMGIEPGRPLLDHKVDVVFVGSCTNGRISDLRQAASLLRGRKVAKTVRVLVVPGSRAVKQQAEAEGLDQVFCEAGAEWREPGCSMCIAMNGDQAAPGQIVVSTSNRNFEGRQGTGARTLLVSPLTAAAAAVTGRIADPRVLMRS